MSIRFPKKSEKFSEPEPESESKPASTSTSESGFNAESMFKKLTAKLRWEKEHIEPELGELFPSYDDKCYIFLTPQCDEGYVGEGYGFFTTLAWNNTKKLVGVWLKCGQSTKKQKKGK